MKKRTVISNVPIRLPIQNTILTTFLLWHFDVNQIFWGVFITVYTLLWAIALIAKFNENRIDLDKELLNGVKSKLAQRIEQMEEMRAKRNKTK